MKSLPRSTPAVILGVAILMLLATTGGAVAGSLITGKQIKNGTITSADIKNRTITKKDLAAATLPVTGGGGATGATGPQGATGATGAQGPRGYSAWDTIPSGLTVTGSFYVDTSTTGSVTSDALWVPLPGRPSGNLTSVLVNFAPHPDVGDGDATCTGTFLAPTAPAGKVCLYLGGGERAGALRGFTGNRPVVGFVVQWLPATTTPGLDLLFEATWAYTAP